MNATKWTSLSVLTGTIMAMILSYGCANGPHWDPQPIKHKDGPTGPRGLVWEALNAQVPTSFICSGQDQVTGLTLDLYGTRETPSSPWVVSKGIDGNGQVFFFELGESSSFDIFVGPGNSIPSLSSSTGINMSKVFYDGNSPFNFTGKTASQWIFYYSLFPGEEEGDPVERDATLNSYTVSNNAITAIDVTLPYRSDWSMYSPLDYNGMKYGIAQLPGSGGGADFQSVRISGNIADVAKFAHRMGVNEIDFTKDGSDYHFELDEEESEVRIYINNSLYSTISCTF